MTPRTTADIRRAYLDFFASKGHAVIPGASLVPENDPTVLFTTAGMHPLVSYLLGQAHPMGKRLCDVQLCVRTQDIDEVGDSSHLTCFEMLGNWSLGDYFKRGAIELSFEFLTTTLGIPVNMLAVTCFAGDDDAPRDEESALIWEAAGIPRERIGFLPKAKNWWGPAGKTGPCGPDTEMFYWIGEGEPKGNPATHDAEWMEIWNDVFMQYGKQEDGSFVPLAQQNVDTGMGLERVAAVLQGVKSVYDTDAFSPLLTAVKSKATKESLKDARIIVDHLKAATFIIADGVRPGNVDQGYVLRRIIRRAIRSARKLGIEHAAGYCASIAEVVVNQYGDFYHKLRSEKRVIAESLNREEEAFMKTLTEGLKHFQKVVDNGTQQIAGIDAFRLYDTYGFPIEITREMAAEQSRSIDESGFMRAFEQHQALSRAGAEKRFAGGLADHSGETTKLHTATHLLNAALRKVLGEHVSQKGSNITAERLRFDFNHPEKMTPEQIKQVEDLVNDAIRADVPVRYSVMTVDEAKAAGAIGVFGDKYASISLSTGSDKVKVYTMGDDSPQPGSQVPGISSPQPGSRIPSIPSPQPGSRIPSIPSPQPGRRVPETRVFSKEICGGPHVAGTGMLGSFKIQKEESSSSGVRRIKAVVSGGPKEIEVAGEA